MKRVFIKIGEKTIKAKAIIITIYGVILFVAGAFTYYKIYGVKTITKIEKQEIKTNVIVKDTSTMSSDELRAELECYYKSNPFLDITQIDNNVYDLSAGLCERKWSRRVTIPQLYHKNIITAMASVKSNFTYGAGFNYTRMITNIIGVGGGFTMYKDNSFVLDITGSISF